MICICISVQKTQKIQWWVLEACRDVCSAALSWKARAHGVWCYPGSRMPGARLPHEYHMASRVGGITFLETDHKLGRELTVERHDRFVPYLSRGIRLLSWCSRDPADRE